MVAADKAGASRQDPHLRSHLSEFLPTKQLDPRVFLD
jgi:hypothetical protein